MLVAMTEKQDILERFTYMLQLQLNSITENANNPPSQSAMTAQSSQTDRDLDTDMQRQIQSHVIETTLQTTIRKYLKE